MRKLFIFFVLLVVAGAVTSCLEYKEPQYSPTMSSSPFFVNPVFDGDSLIGAQDTLDLVYDAQDGSYEMDTVYLGDTVMFASTFYTYTSNLISIEIKWERDLMQLWYPLVSSITDVLTDKTDIAAGKLYFNPGYNRVSFPIYFTPTVRGGMTLKMSVESDSEFPVSSVLIYIPATERPVETED